MNLYVKETGKNNLETIVFIHGDGMAGWMWDEQLKAFNDYHCLVPDLPEHGRSTDVKPFTIEGAANMIMDIIRNQIPEGKAHLVGLSLGAQIIVQILSTAPDVVDHAFISGALVRSAAPTESFIKLLDHLIKIYVPVKNNALYIGSYLRSYNIPKNLRGKFRESTRIIKPDSSARIIKEGTLFKMPIGLENINTPVLAMIGEKDYTIIRESARNLHNSIPNSEGASALKVGHMWNMENPELFNQVLRCFLNNENLPDGVKTL